MEWFEEWFDSPLYEQLYANRNEEEASRLADLIERFVPCSSYPRILDLGCGRGRHSLTLAERGYQVKGIDLSEEAIEKAVIKANERKLKNVSFQVGDMRDPLPETFDAVVNLFTTFGYFEEDEENATVISSVGAMLREGGIFFLDYLNADWVRRNYEPEESGTFKELNYEIRRFIRHDVIYKEITFSGTHLEQPISYTERVKLYDLEWFLENFDDRGFEVERIMGDYKGNSYHPETCSRLVIMARKRG
ncbi:MAG: class I SAM-dependent methyltransferase [Balneolaceae bacterium]